VSLYKQAKGIMLRNQVLFNIFLSQDSFFRDLHSLTYIYILFTSKGVCFSTEDWQLKLHGAQLQKVTRRSSGR
jgi:hypothetical protein